jgi:pimeloyl-ACP methyl ester carboxylesterase
MNAIHQVELSAGTVEYLDTGGPGPVLVFAHGLLMDGSVWRHVVADLAPEYRCVVPTLPLGAHRRPMHPDADLSLSGMARLLGEFVDRLELHEVTLVQNDWGGAQILLALSPTGEPRIARLVLTSCEAFDNYPPAPVRPLAMLTSLPGGVAALIRLHRLRVVRRAPGGWGWMSKRPVPDEVMSAWFRPATTDRAIRRDLGKYITSVPPGRVLLEWAGRAAGFDRPVLVAWAAEDRMMPPAHGRRLAALFPDARHVQIANSYTLIPEDQPAELTRHLREFLTGTAGHPPGSSPVAVTGRP